jgi:hypothetical protein
MPRMPTISEGAALAYRDPLDEPPDSFMKMLPMRLVYLLVYIAQFLALWNGLPYILPKYLAAGGPLMFGLSQVAVFAIILASYT